MGLDTFGYSGSGVSILAVPEETLSDHALIEAIKAGETTEALSLLNRGRILMHSSTILRKAGSSW